MDGIHDLGGKHGFGKVDQRDASGVFHGRWEGAVFTMVNACAAAGVIHNTDQFRHGVERIDPAAYLTDGYYGRWLGGLETLLVEAGVIKVDTLDKRLKDAGHSPGRAAARPSSTPDRFTPDAPNPEAAAGSQRPVSQPARFAVGDQVRTVVTISPGHTRLPAYARGKVGTIIRCHGGWVFPDTNAHGRGEQPQYLYTVGFVGQTLWAGGDPNLSVSLDLFEPYLQSV